MNHIDWRKRFESRDVDGDRVLGIHYSGPHITHYTYRSPRHSDSYNTGYCIDPHKLVPLPGYAGFEEDS